MYFFNYLFLGNAHPLKVLMGNAHPTYISEIQYESYIFSQMNIDNSLR